MAQYSDMPEGATIINDPSQYSDLPAGATIISHPTVAAKPQPIQNSQPAQNVQSNDVGAARYGTLSGTSPESIPQPSMNRYNRMVNAALIRVATALPSLYSHTGLPGSQAAGNLSSDLNLYGTELVNGDSQAMGLPSGQQGPSLHGFGEAAQAAGSMIPATALGAASGLNSLVGGLAEYIPEGVSYLGNIASAAAKGGLGGSLYGALNSLITPTPEGQNYAQHLAPNLAAGAEMGAVFSGGLSAIEGAPSATKAGAEATAKWVRQRFSAEHAAPQVMPGDVPSVNDVMSQPGIRPGTTIPDLQSRVQQGDVGAQQTLQQVRLAASVEHGMLTVGEGGNAFIQPINLSEADRTGDPIARQNEVNLEGQRGSVGRNARVLQGVQINQAIGNLERATNIPLPPNADTSAIIQDGAQHQFETNRAIATNKYEGMYGAIDQKIADSKTSGAPIDPEVNVTLPVQKMMNLMEQNKVTLAQDPELSGILNNYAKQIETHLADPTTSPDMLSVRGIKNAVTNMESQVEQMKGGTNPNRNGARLLNDVTRLFDQAADDKAVEILGSDSQVKDASQYYKEKVVPFLDHDSGLPQIREGNYPDKATKAFLQTSSPDQFKTLVDNLPDPQVRQALKSKILEAATDQATQNRTAQLDPKSWAAFLAKRGEELPNLYDDPAELHHVQSLVDLVQNTPRAGAVAPIPSILQMSGRSYTAKAASSLTGGLLGGPLGAIAAPLVEEGAEIGYNRTASRTAFVPDFNETAQKIGLTKENLTPSTTPQPRSVGAAGQPSASLTEAFESPAPNPQFTMQGRAGTGYADPYARLKQLQANAAAQTGDVRTAQDNYINSVLGDRQLANQVKQAHTAAQTAFEQSGGTGPYGWEEIEKGSQFRAQNPNSGAYVSPHEPAPWEHLQEVRNPTPDEMRDVATRVDNYIGWLSNPNRGDTPTIMDLSNKYLHRPMSDQEISAEIPSLSAIRDQINDYASKVEKGLNPPVPVQMDLINKLSSATSRLRDLNQLASDTQNSPINTQSLANEVADAKAAQAKAFSDLIQAGPNQRQPVPANNPATTIPTQSLTAPFAEPGGGVISNPRTLPGQPNTMTEPYAQPQSGQGLSSFGEGSVGAGRSDLNAGQNRLDQAMAELRARQAKQNAPTPSLSEAQRTFESVQNDLGETPIQKAARELSQAQEQMRQTGIKADEAAKQLAARRLSEGLAETPPQSPYDKPEQAVPVDPQGPLAKLKAWAQVHGFLPAEPTPMAPQTATLPHNRPLPEPEGNPQSHTLVTAKGSLDELMSNLSRLQQQQPPQLQGPYQNPIYAAQHPLPTRIELSSEPIDTTTGKPVESDIDELARQLEIERPDLIDLRDAKISFGNAEPKEPSAQEVFEAGNKALKQMGAEPSTVPSLAGSSTDKGFAMSAYQDYMQQTTAKQLEYQKQLADAKQLGASADQIRQMQIDQNKHLGDRKTAAQKMLPFIKKGDEVGFNTVWQGRP